MNKIRHLIDYFIPDNYQLDLTIDKANRRFSGRVVITGQPTGKPIRLHAKNLQVSQVLVDGEEVDWRQEDDELVLRQKLADQIAVAYDGQIDETAMNGLYLCKYKVDGQTKELFATQFESHYARECFPCIDEPAAKATFDVTIHTTDPDDSIILSNMPGHRVNSQTWRFDRTPRMSTYLLAFVGGDLIKQSTTTDNGIAINVYATPAQSPASLQYALDIARQSVEFYEDYFGIRYPLPKLDNVALPDFSAGAMENWGLITYRETALLADDQSAEDTREYIATVVAHEIAHQWFGDLVTMRWWNDLWLNESFASLMENTAVDHIHPEYRIWEDFDTSDTISALSRDALPGVQAVQQDVASPADIASLFDGAIVYAKGERLMRMLRDYIGEPAFRHGLSQYFRQHQFDNTVADDLWAALSDASGTDVKALMDPWLVRPGYPIVHAQLNDAELTLRQEQFLATGSTADSPVWPIPLFSNIPGAPALMTTASLTIAVPADMTEPIQLNVGGTAHFIVDYDDELASALTSYFGQLTVADQIKLLSEASLQAKYGWSDIAPAYHLVQHAAHLTNQAVLSAASSILGSFDILVEPNSTDESKLKQLNRHLYGDQFVRLFQANAHTTDEPAASRINSIKSLSTVLSRCIYGELPEALSYCQKLFDQYHQHPSAIPANIRAAVLRCVIKHGDPSGSLFNQLWQNYQSSQDADYRTDLCLGLTGTTDAAHIQQLLDAATQTDVIRPQDNFYFIMYLLANPHARSMAWQWIRDHWDWIVQTYGGDMSYDFYARAAGASLRTNAELSQYDDFFSSIDQTGLERTIALGHQDIASRIDWIKRNQPILHQLLP